MGAVAVVLTGLAVALLVPTRRTVRSLQSSALGDRTSPRPGRHGRRLGVSVLAGAGAGVVVGGPLALPVGVVVGLVVWVVAGRVEPRAVRLRREQVRRDLPHLVTLLGAALRSGTAPAAAIDLVRVAFPGAAADVLAPFAARLALGADPAAVWAALAEDPVVGSLGRALERAHRSGAPVVAAVERLSVELARQARGEVEDRARAVGVRAAVPLGVCLLPSFLLLGIVPLVAGLARSIVW